MPPDIPPEIAGMLDRKGIVAPATSRWRRLDDWPMRMIRAHCYCECTKPVQRVELAAMRLPGRHVFLGQCGACGVIYWREAVRE
jgi:hypothetical protein